MYDTCVKTRTLANGTLPILGLLNSPRDARATLICPRPYSARQRGCEFFDSNRLGRPSTTLLVVRPKGASADTVITLRETTMASVRRLLVKILFPALLFFCF